MKKVIGLVLLVVVLVVPSAAAQQESMDPEALRETFSVEFNRILRANYRAPALARNEVLEEVAQEIADSIGCSDDLVDFDIQREVADRGYTVYPGDTKGRTTRIPLLPVVNLRPIEEIVSFYAGDIYGNNISQPGLFYREMGVGVTPCIAPGGSTQQYSLFLILGAQPDVIPVVIENGETSLEVEAVPVTVGLSLHEEKSRPRDGIFGRGETVRLGVNEPLEDSVRGKPYTQFMEIELESCGENTVYYELTDTSGLTVAGQTSITLECPD